MVMGFSHDPGPLPFACVRDAVKWLPRLTNGQIEIRGENGLALEQRMVRIADITYPYSHEEARAHGLFVPAIYAGRKLVRVRLEALDGR
jgi:hypothetical protein